MEPPPFVYKSPYPLTVRGLGEGRNGELVFNGIEFPFGNMTVLEMDGGDGCMML